MQNDEDTIEQEMQQLLNELKSVEKSLSSL